VLYYYIALKSICQGVFDKKRNFLFLFFIMFKDKGRKGLDSASPILNSLNCYTIFTFKEAF
jgi:hypothetical protein